MGISHIIKKNFNFKHSRRFEGGSNHSISVVYVGQIVLFLSTFAVLTLVLKMTLPSTLIAYYFAGTGIMVSTVLLPYCYRTLPSPD